MAARDRLTGGGRRLGWLAGMVAATALVTSPSDAVDSAPLIMGAGNVMGAYYAVGGAVARTVTMAAADADLRILVESTNGAAENLIRTADGDLDLGLAPSDLVHAAYNGFGQFDGEARLTGLRTLITLHAEPLIVLARAETEAAVLDDLRGTRLNLGVPGTPGHALLQSVLDTFEWSEGDRADLARRPRSTQLDALCNGRLDAIAFTAASPSASLAMALAACDVVVVEISGAQMERLLTEHPYLTATVVRADLYPTLAADVATVGVVATLVAADRLDDADAYRIAAAVAGNLETVAALHPVLADLTLEMLLSDRQSAPLHDGVRRYLQDSGRL